MPIRGAGAEDVVVADAEAAGVRAAAAPGAEARVERPRIARCHLDVDHAVVHGRRADHDLVEIAVAAQQPLGFVDQPRRDRLAALEQQRALDHAGVRDDVQPVGGAEQRLVLVRVGEVEDLARQHAHLAVRAPAALEFGEAGQRGVVAQRAAGAIHAGPMHRRMANHGMSAVCAMALAWGLRSEPAQIGHPAPARRRAPGRRPAGRSSSC